MIKGSERTDPPRGVLFLWMGTVTSGRIAATYFEELEKSLSADGFESDAPSSWFASTFDLPYDKVRRRTRRPRSRPGT